MRGGEVEKKTDEKGIEQDRERGCGGRNRRWRKGDGERGERERREREGERERGREGGKEGGKEGGEKGGREGGRERGRKGERREGGREGKKKGGREEGRERRREGGKEEGRRERDYCQLLDYLEFLQFCIKFFYFAVSLFKGPRYCIGIS